MIRITSGVCIVCKVVCDSTQTHTCFSGLVCLAAVYVYVCARQVPAVAFALFGLYGNHYIVLRC